MSRSRSPPANPEGSKVFSDDINDNDTSSANNHSGKVNVDAVSANNNNNNNNSTSGVSAPVAPARTTSSAMNSSNNNNNLSRAALLALTVQDLGKLLKSKGINDNVVIAIESNDYGGLEFCEDGFVDAAFDATELAKHPGIKALHLNALRRVHAELVVATQTVKPSLPSSSSSSGAVSLHPGSACGSANNNNVSSTAVTSPSSVSAAGAAVAGRHSSNYDPSHNRLYVGGIGNSTRSEIIAFFIQRGCDVAGADLRVGINGAPHIAFINMRDVASVQRALNLTGESISGDGNHIIVKGAEKCSACGQSGHGSTSAMCPMRNRGGGGGGGGGGSGVGRHDRNGGRGNGCWNCGGDHFSRECPRRGNGGGGGGGGGGNNNNTNNNNNNSSGGYRSGGGGGGASGAGWGGSMPSGAGSDYRGGDSRDHNRHYDEDRYRR